MAETALSAELTEHLCLTGLAYIPTWPQRKIWVLVLVEVLFSQIPVDGYHRDSGWLR